MKDKNALRHNFYQRRAEATDNDSNATKNLAQAGLEALDGLLSYGATNVTGYWPVLGEIDPQCLLQELHRRNATLALPAIIEKKVYDLEFRFWTPGTPVVAGAFDIPVAPPENGVMVEPDILLVPLLAFDQDGFRLGYGGGYYDGVLARLRSRTRNRPFRLLAFGLAFASQEIEALPREPHDQPLDGVLTPEGMIWTSESPA